MATHRIDERSDLSPFPGVTYYEVTYESQQYKVKADLAIPAGEGPFPAILYCRGGLKKVGQVRPERIAQLASFGYVVLAPHYRGNRGGEGEDEFGGEDRHDVYSALEVLKELSNVDRNRISLYGFSRGGMMALLAAIEREGFHSVVVWSGVSDVRLTFEEREDMRRMLVKILGTPEERPEEYDRRTPLLQIDKIKCPVLIIHGKEDQNVGVDHAYRLAEQLKKFEKPHELWVAEGASHLFSPQQIEEYTRRMFEWLGSPRKV